MTFLFHKNKLSFHRNLVESADTDTSYVTHKQTFI